jgi:serine/threonine protein kinase/tetratricopeptide (TPR) repeat protein
MNETATAKPGRPLRAPYVLHERLGAGGQAEVWRARDPNRETDIALKILRPGPGRAEAAWEALQHEYASASRLNHPYILTVYPPERDESIFLMPMELAAGGDLRRLRGAGYLTIVPVLIEVAQALEHAHQHGVIHRDLKPGNVLFDARGRVKLADFGVSGRAPDSGTDALIRGLSPFTASPEQLRGEPPAPSDDIYSLGALAYELLSLHPPHYPHFDARRVQEEPVPPMVPTEQIPQQLDAAIMRMLAKDAKARPASMKEVIEDLDAALNGTLIFHAGTTLASQAVPSASPQLDDLSVTLPPGVLPASTPPAAVPTLAAVSQLHPRRRGVVSVASRSVPPPPAVPRAVPPRAVPPVGAAPRSGSSRPLPPWLVTPRVPRALPAAATPAPAAAGTVEGTGVEELRYTPVPVPPLEPMRSNLPQALLLLGALAAATVAIFVLLPRHLTGAMEALQPPSPAAEVSAPSTPTPAAAPFADPLAHSTPAGPPAAAATKPAAAASEPTPALRSDGYASAAGEGFAALGAGRLNEARAAFEKARALRPNGAEAIDGLRRVEAATTAHGFEAIRAHATDLEAQERWEDALSIYRSVLRLDPAQAFAQAGKERATARMQLNDGLQALLDRPDRITTPQAREQSAVLLQSAAEVSSPGPLLSSQIAKLTALLPGVDKPVHLSLVSDSLTQVAIPSVGTFGSFSQRDIELKPGHYTVIGTRDGYRDVHRDLTVSPGQGNQTINVTCDEPI